MVALSHGSKIWGVPAARITGRLMAGLRALKSSKETPANLAATSTSISRSMGTLLKKGWFWIRGNWVLKASGWATMFLTACNLGT